MLFHTFFNRTVENFHHKFIMRGLHIATMAHKLLRRFKMDFNFSVLDSCALSPIAFDAIAGAAPRDSSNRISCVQNHLGYNAKNLSRR